MKFADRTPIERTAIDAWIRVTIMIREDACMKVPEDFRTVREESLSKRPEEVARMLRHYADYRTEGHRVSYTQYFQVSHPEEYAAILRAEKAENLPA